MPRPISELEHTQQNLAATRGQIARLQELIKALSESGADINALEEFLQMLRNTESLLESRVAILTPHQ